MMTAIVLLVACFTHDCQPATHGHVKQPHTHEERYDAE